jgi:hypothetical protein
MKDIARMRLGVLRELKYVRQMIDTMERNVKGRNPEAIERSYIWLQTLVVQMNDGELSPKGVALNLELARALHEEMNRD